MSQRSWGTFENTSASRSRSNGLKGVPCEPQRSTGASALECNTYHMIIIPVNLGEIQDATEDDSPQIHGYRDGGSGDMVGVHEVIETGPVRAADVTSVACRGPLQ